MRRTKMPKRVMPALAAIPIWIIFYVGTLEAPEVEQTGALAVGDEIYASCSGCHGGTGGGGSGPALSGGAVLETFPAPADQLRWIIEGTDGFNALGIETYGATDKPVGGGGNMPAFDNLTAEELIGVVRHERETLSGEEFDPESYAAIMEMVEAEYPDRTAEFEEAIVLFEETDEG